jgi:quercetin dioxygenase-like cupin family protein
MSASDGKATVVEPGVGERVDLYGLEILYTVTASDTGGQVSIVEHVIRPGVLVKPHVHSREDEISIVLEGAIAARVGDEIIRVGAGSYLVKPRNVPHAIWNDGTVPSRVAELVSPAGFEDYFRELAPILIASPGRPVYEALADRYGIRILDDWTEELEAQYGVKL